MKSMFSKMLVSAVIILMITLLVTSGILLNLTFEYVQKNEEKAAMTSAQELGSLLKYRAPENAQLFNRIVDSYATKLDATVFACDTNGLVVISSGSVGGTMRENVPVGCMLTENQYKAVVSGETVDTRGDFDGFFSKNVIIAGVPLNINGSIRGGVFVCRTIPTPDVMSGNMGRYFISGIIISLLLASVINYVTARIITAPITKMKRAARAFAAGDFSQRACIKGSGELAELAAEFDNMADSLQNLENNRQAFVADISHELRTPMTTISGFVEGMLDGTIPESSRDKYLEIVLDESKRLTRLVNDILYAEKYRRGEATVSKEAFDINEVIRLVLISLERQISEKRINAEVRFEYESCFVFADRDSITRVITNLVDNAVKFADDGGQLIISSENENGKCRISVFNTGSFISDDDRTRIFDRFYKSDRSRGMDKSGVGLGLHIVKSILAQHSSVINVESNDRGTTFEFLLKSATR